MRGHRKEIDLNSKQQYHEKKSSRVKSKANEVYAKHLKRPIICVCENTLRREFCIELTIFIDFRKI
ncbi:hypothetical protein D3C79_760750 [compost metagenome]